jgi:hypothetical protein
MTYYSCLPLLLFWLLLTKQSTSSSSTNQSLTVDSTANSDEQIVYRNLDRFNYRKTEIGESFGDFGPEDWGQIQCTDVEKCVSRFILISCFTEVQGEKFSQTFTKLLFCLAGWLSR